MKAVSNYISKLVLVLFVIICSSCNQLGRNGAKTISKKVGKETVEKGTRLLGRQTAKELGEEITEKSFKQSLKQGLKTSASKLAKTIPYGGGINKEGRTLEEIASKPLLDQQIAAFKNFCQKEGINSDICKKILADFTKKRGIPKPSVNGHVDFSKAAIEIGKFPTKEVLEKMLKEQGLKATSANIRKIHYDLALEAFAKKYGITKKQASQIIGNQFDHVIHEAENGAIQIVPNNIHRFQALYKHNGLVAKRVKELTGEIIEEAL